MDAHGDECLVIEGVLDGRRVGAVWQNGAVTGDLDLLLAAGDVIASGAHGDNGSGTVRASYADLGSAIVALCRALDVVDSVKVTLSGSPSQGAPAPHRPRPSGSLETRRKDGGCTSNSHPVPRS